MSIKLRKIGVEKANVFNKKFDSIYDYWKNRAISEHGYDGDLKLIKERNKVFIYIIIEDIDQFTDREEWHPPIDDED
jgi:uncharacterized membrane protein